MTELFVVWSPGAFTSATVGGLLVGLLLVTRFDNPRFHATESIAIVLVIGIVGLTVFWSGQIVDTYSKDGPTLAWRVVSRYLLQIVWLAFLAVGTGVGVRRARGSWTA